MDGTDIADPMRISLAVAGKSGTLSDRMRGTAPAAAAAPRPARCSGVSNLAGYCTSRSGARVAFAFLMSGVSVYTAHPLQDRMAAVLARYRP